ncbi:MAG: N-acetylmuramoyl-L-alanine amidase [Coriobacteriales bacterium]|jgi:N-acetyl-anhydromuramyl-L-alanine amidase AmpD|nr:N-acetylmuramoyl-L-alanine amidase [Coriobacteriales bacterium]
MSVPFIKLFVKTVALIGALSLVLALAGCALNAQPTPNGATSFEGTEQMGDTMPDETDALQKAEEESRQAAEKAASAAAAIKSTRTALNLSEDYRPSFVHGEKPAQFQKYIVLHDTEGDSSPQSVIDWWDSNGNLVAAHFVIGKDGAIMQCVPMDAIAHHAGFGDAGHNASFGVEDESRDDKLGTVPIGSWAPDYGMNSYSIGIEMVHVGGSGYYPEAQLDALDALIAYIDAYYGFPSQITDHKSWRSGNSDTSPEFAGYLANYQATRNHRGA